MCSFTRQKAAESHVHMPAKSRPDIDVDADYAVQISVKSFHEFTRCRCSHVCHSLSEIVLIMCVLFWCDKAREISNQFTMYEGD